MTQDLSHYQDSYYERDIEENWYGNHGLLRPDELAALGYAFGRTVWHPRESKPRDPGVVYSIGCGLGRLERQLETMGVEVYGVDPSPGAAALYQGKTLLDHYPGGGDTILFVESLEHIPLEEIRSIWQRLPRGARVIVVNWVDFFPIPADSSWDHITEITNELFDELSIGCETILRRNGHLVLEKL